MLYKHAKLAAARSRRSSVQDHQARAHRPLLTRPASTNATLNACGVPPGDSSAKLIVIPAAFGSIVITLVIIRVVSRIWSSNLKLEWDDYLILASAVSASERMSLHPITLTWPRIGVCNRSQRPLLSQ